MLIDMYKWRVQVAAVMLCISGMVFGQSDIKDSSDPQRLERFPLSWIVSYKEQAAPEYSLATGPMKKIEGVIAPEAFDRISGQLTRITYRIPDTHSPDDVYRHYFQQLESLKANILYQCASRRCGSSNQWANNYFGVKELYGITRSQFYLAASLGTQRIALYTVKRGNRRIYLHLDLIEPQAQSVASVRDDLLQKGFSWLQSQEHEPLLLTLLNDDESLQLLIVGYDKAIPTGDSVQQTRRSAALAEALRQRLIVAGIASERLESMGVGPAVPVVRPPALQGIWIQLR